MRHIIFRASSIGLLAALVAGILGNLTTAAHAASQTTPKNPSKNSLKKPSAKSQDLMKPQAKGVAAKYSEAMKLYDAGKYNEALVAFDQLHKSYPAHEPTIIQYAKTLYRLDRINESYNLFARINPQYLDAETSYEYGFSFYTVNKFDGALYAFKRVPNNHALYDLANYYGAMSALRMKRYADAEELLDKAVVLPDKLSRSKSLYQKHIASLRQLQEKNELDRNIQEERLKSANDATKKIPQAAPTALTGGSPAAPAPYTHNGFYFIDRVANLKATQKSQRSNYHGYSQKSYDKKVGTFSLLHGPLIPIPYKIEPDRQAAFGLQISAAVSSVTTTGTQERLVSYEDSREIVHQLTEKLPTQTTTLGDIGGATWIEAPLPNGWWIGGDGHLSFTYPNFERGQRYGIRGVNGNIGWKKDTTLYASLNGIYDLIVDSETEPVTAQTITAASFGGFTSFDMEIVGSAKYIHYDYKITTLSGPDTSTSGSIKFVQKFPLSISLTLSGTAEQQKNYIVRDVGSFVSASADGTIVSGFAEFKASPFPWITVAAKHLRSQATWSVLQPEREEAFKAATPSYTESTDLTGSINFIF
jgi:tetratricopeptide (TPR) repeat protein